MSDRLFSLWDPYPLKEESHSKILLSEIAQSDQLNGESHFNEISQTPVQSPTPAHSHTKVQSQTPAQSLTPEHSYTHAQTPFEFEVVKRHEKKRVVPETPTQEVLEFFDGPPKFEIPDSPVKIELGTAQTPS